MTQLRILAIALIAVLAVDAAVQADVLVLRNGRRITGTLVAVRGDTIEFDESDGRDRGRIRRYDRNDVRSVLFDDDGGSDDDRPGRGGGVRERTVAVEARTAWTDTGIDVRNGQDVRFAASGQVRWGPDRRDGPAGERNSPFNRARPMPDRSAAALIGRVGPNGDPFLIGDARQSFRLRGSGRLYLGINDDFLQDNSGSFRVVIGY
jgi:hypothetical protein